MTRVLVVQGHPDTEDIHFCHVLAEAYVCGAEGEGHQVRRLEVANLDFPVLTSKRDWLHAEAPSSIADAQEDLLWADHILIAFPLWFGDMPALLKAFLEQLLRPGFAFTIDDEKWEPLLSGKTARILTTTNMPAYIYRWGSHADAIRILGENILVPVGIRPVGETVVGEIDNLTHRDQKRWTAKMHEYGSSAQ